MAYMDHEEEEMRKRVRVALKKKRVRSKPLIVLHEDNQGYASTLQKMARYWCYDIRVTKGEESYEYVLFLDGTDSFSVRNKKYSHRLPYKPNASDEMVILRDLHQEILRRIDA